MHYPCFPVTIPKGEYISELNKTVARLEENALLTGDAQVTAQKIVRKMKMLVAENKGNASGLLKARKQLDEWVKAQKGAGIFDPNRENAISISLREIRQSTNDFIDARATNVGVKDSLRRQAALFNAMENMTPKVADEAATRFGRAWQKMSRVLPIRGEFNQAMATLVGVGGLGASAAFAPFFTKAFLGGLSRS